ncbi:AAA family ATPase [Mucilaginibacter jinjuensis]|uniref:ATP-binding protein n=1 Tax=Mucilaginibacter jinjuensis TaxID=1176721 RepID=A0ABY7T933_9SPHI|nr:ATP-binding protein [Mucilaginibacter jinjuensis]WCT12872.1 ATP-binding protein [Mucilaginibacter jinjuensis]
MIKKLIVEGLNNRKEPLELIFHPDLNLLTGKNGSSKTTVLKLIWFLNSGRILNLIKEINFVAAELTTSNSLISIKRDIENNTVTIGLDKEKPFTLSDLNLRELELRRPTRINDRFLEITKLSIPTIFFPTFRRIEGGFTMEEGFDPRFGRQDQIRNALEEFSARMSSKNQRFITSISTDDIIQLLNREYSNINALINLGQKQKSDEIIRKIKIRQKSETETLAEIQSDIESMETERETLLKPYTTLSELITTIFQHKGINLSNLTIGEVNNAISSDKLSAGEKQMLSFICYNAFTKNHSIFIDEPELSLHPDWQRTLVPTLLNQGNNNQFFMATHSPFIFSKYSDKEIILSNDKGI